MLTVNDIKGLHVLIPTPAHHGADSWKAKNTVNFDEAKRHINKLIEDGVDGGIWTNGTLGEGPTLTWDESLAFNEMLVSELNGRLPLFSGATTLNTRDTIERAKQLRDAGVTGLLLGRPMWCQMDIETMVRFYYDVAEAVPELAIIVYDNGAAFKGEIPTEVFARIAEIPQVVGVKNISVSFKYLNDLKAVSGKIRIMPKESEWYYAWKWCPEMTADAVWSWPGAVGPAPVVALKRAIQSGDDALALKITQDIRFACSLIYPPGGFPAFVPYNIPLIKEYMRATGYVDPGPCRPPYTYAPDELLERERIGGKRWAEIHEKYKSYC